MAGFGTNRQYAADAISEDEERRFLTAERPDGPIFGLRADAHGFSHIVTPTFVVGRDHGWFSAFCYRCNSHERFRMTGLSYFDPFTGEALTRNFSEALAAGSQLRTEWMRRRKALRDSIREEKRKNAQF